MLADPIRASIAEAGDSSSRATWGFCSRTCVVSIPQLRRHAGSEILHDDVCIGYEARRDLLVRLESSNPKTTSRLLRFIAMKFIPSPPRKGGPNRRASSPAGDSILVRQRPDRPSIIVR